MRLHTFFKNALLAVSTVAMVSITSTAAANEEHDLQKAFFKEYTFLLKEKKALEKRLENIKDQNFAEKKSLQSKINGLKENVRSTDLEAERINDHIITVEKETIAKESNQGVYEATLDQANATLDPENNNRQTNITGIVSTSINMLEQNTAVRTETSVFYLKDGSEVQGQIVHFGGVARYGISANETGPLAPAGGGAFKLWKSSAQPEAVSNLANGNIAPSLEIFLFESPTKEVKEVVEKDVLSIINSGGMVAWIIVGLGAIAIFFAILKALFLITLGSKSNQQFNQIAEAVAKNDLEQAKELAKETKGSIKRVVNTTLNNITQDREHVEDAISEAILHENTALDRFQSIIMIIAAISPLLGLLGTVTGMIETFDIITEYGTGDPKLLSGGISIALVTTELGLIVAIPVLVIGTLLAGWSNKIKDEIEKSALHIVNQYQNTKNH